MLLFVMLSIVQPAAPPNGSPPPGVAIFISPMGEPSRADGKISPVRRWIRAADTSGDGWISRAEFAQDAERFFAMLDLDSSGGIDPDEMKRYEREVAPRDLRMIAAGRRPAGFAGGRPAQGDRSGGPPPGGGPGGGGERGMERSADGERGPLQRELPQPVASADTDMNRLVTSAEFRAAAVQRFTQRDRNGDGRLVEGELGPDRLPDRRGRR